jgi:hypothetical protein
MPAKPNTRSPDLQALVRAILAWVRLVLEGHAWRRIDAPNEPTRPIVLNQSKYGRPPGA